MGRLLTAAKVVVTPENLEEFLGVPVSAGTAADEVAGDADDEETDK